MKRDPRVDQAYRQYLHGEGKLRDLVKDWTKQEARDYWEEHLREYTERHYRKIYGDERVKWKGELAQYKAKGYVTSARWRFEQMAKDATCREKRKVKVALPQNFERIGNNPDSARWLIERSMEDDDIVLAFRSMMTILGPRFDRLVEAARKENGK